MKIVGLQPRDKVVMSRGLNNKIFFSKNLHENRVYFPEERSAFVDDHQHGRRKLWFANFSLTFDRFYSEEKKTSKKCNCN